MRRRDLLARTGAAAALIAGCRTSRSGKRIVLRLSHSMTAGNTALDAFATAFRELAEAGTGGAVEVRIFSSGTLGQEREVVQQLQEGLVDFVVSGSAIWGPPELRPRLETAALDAARRLRAMGPAEDRTAKERLAEQGMTIRDIDRSAFLGPAEALWHAQARELDAVSWLRAALG